MGMGPGATFCLIMRLTCVSVVTPEMSDLLTRLDTLGLFPDASGDRTDKAGRRHCPGKDSHSYGGRGSCYEQAGHGRCKGREPLCGQVDDALDSALQFIRGDSHLPGHERSTRRGSQDEGDGYRNRHHDRTRFLS